MGRTNGAGSVPSRGVDALTPPSAGPSADDGLADGGRPPSAGGRDGARNRRAAANALADLSTNERPSGPPPGDRPPAAFRPSGRAAGPAPGAPVGKGSVWDGLARDVDREGSLAWPDELTASDEQGRLSGTYLDFVPPADTAVSPGGRGAVRGLLDRRSSAALPAPELSAEDRRNAVALSLAGLFEDAEDPEAPEAHENGPSHVRKPSSFFDAAKLFEDEEEQEEKPKQRLRPRTMLAPGSIVALVAIAIALYVVAGFVMRSHPSKPVPNQNQVSTATR